MNRVANTRRRWTGPLDSDLAGPIGPSLKHPVPPERWPYGPPSFHEDCCNLHFKGLFCDCAASDSTDVDYGEKA